MHSFYQNSQFYSFINNYDINTIFLIIIDLLLSGKTILKQRIEQDI